jgi:hypothetical protein
VQESTKERNMRKKITKEGDRKFGRRKKEI